jgi:hypothetical protein
VIELGDCYGNKVGSVEIELIDDAVFPKEHGILSGLRRQHIRCANQLHVENRDSFIGNYIEIIFQEHGAKDKPRMGRIVRTRPDRD